MKKITIQDVAKESGVSITTVSRVINKNYPVKESTRLKVEEVIQRLKFKPNLLAKSLIQNFTKTIGILTPSIENLFFSEVIKGIDGVIKSLGYTTFLCHTEGDVKQEVDMINSLVDRRVDGIIMIDPRRDNIKSGLLEELSLTISLILINGYSSGVKCNYILNDAESGVNEALNNLRQSGCKNIALLRGGNSFSYDIKEEVYLDFTKIYNLKSNVIRINEGNDLSTVELAKKGVIDSLNSNNSPDGILCCNDWMAVGALNAAKYVGVSVPKELRIIGFDNTIISQITEPKLSTVDQQMAKLGELAAKRIYTMMTSEDDENQKIYLETKLIIRDS
ncbi:MAG: LacI family transcriptional regulator [Spirochaetaceae bacterium]